MSIVPGIRLIREWSPLPLGGFPPKGNYSSSKARHPRPRPRPRPHHRHRAALGEKVLFVPSARAIKHARQIKIGNEHKFVARKSTRQTKTQKQHRRKRSNESNII